MRDKIWAVLEILSGYYAVEYGKRWHGAWPGYYGASRLSVYPLDGNALNSLHWRWLRLVRKYNTAVAHHPL